jgi:hypothetical protein
MCGRVKKTVSLNGNVNITGEGNLYFTIVARVCWVIDQTKEFYEVKPA